MHSEIFGASFFRPIALDLLLFFCYPITYMFPDLFKITPKWLSPSRMPSEKSKHVTVQLGVWTVVVKKSSAFTEWLPDITQWNKLLIRPHVHDKQKKSDVKDTASESEKSPNSNRLPLPTAYYLYRFVNEIYGLGPIYFCVDILMNVWWMIAGASSLYFTSRLLDSISLCLEKHELHAHSIAHALVGRILLAIMSRFLWRFGGDYSAILKDRVAFHFLAKAMHSSLKFDLQTAEDPEVKSKLDSSMHDIRHLHSPAWNAFEDLFEVLFGLLTICSELFLILSLARRDSSFTLAISLCLIQPCVLLINDSGLFSRSYASYCSNEHFSCMAALHELAYDKSFREDCLSGNLGDHIEKEFKKSRDALGDTCADIPYIQWWRKEPLIWGIVSDLSWNIPLLFFALRVIWNPQDMSITSLMIIQQTTQTVQATSSMLLHNLKKVSSHLRTIRNLYGLSETQNKMQDGDTPYPLKEEGNGAEIEFRNVSFLYPGTSKNVLSDVSFAIKPGQLVVIVGVNGSGKSSAIKLLGRLHDPTGGQILLDGRPLASYKLSDVRNAIAILRQDHPVFPLSLRANIMLGQPNSERTLSDEDVAAAIRQGGAERFVQKLANGAETVLNPVKTATTYFVGETDPALKAVVEEREKTTDLSGGETQRLSASRTFFRLMNGNIRLLAADEPTSALDPEGEYELFTRLREHSGGKTVIFITHRFGHLTKYADLILCMKDGRLVEQGTHDSLMATGGEYKKLHTVQSKAFVSE
ncbi:P-loop containing nucleoside triphosphate hydrolase protein [Phellopilus nigrolimitatus]|nr:P-loop containing nucleoside triphosphate hydrolase protein [Phellopilus nigrolimitatus]